MVEGVYERLVICAVQCSPIIDGGTNRNRCTVEQHRFSVRSFHGDFCYSFVSFSLTFAVVKGQAIVCMSDECEYSDMPVCLSALVCAYVCFQLADDIQGFRAVV